MSTAAAPGAGAAVPELGLGELAAFVVLAEERSFTRSARRLHLSQPGLSARIMRLERALGVRLVHRTTRTVELTAAGEQLLPVAHDAVQSLAAVRARLSTGESRRRDVVAEARAVGFR